MVVMVIMFNVHFRAKCYNTRNTPVIRDACEFDVINISRSKFSCDGSKRELQTMIVHGSED